MVSDPFPVPAVFVAEMGTAAIPALMGVPLMVPLEIERFAVAAPSTCDNVAAKEVALLLAVMM